jgi:3'-5' exoribonuclease
MTEYPKEIIDRAKATKTFLQLEKCPNPSEDLDIDKKDLVKILIEIVAYKDFDILPAARFHHHNYKGGLDIHTAEVIDYALQLNQMMGKPFKDSDVITVGFLHDIGKIYVYEIDGDDITVNKDLPCSEEALTFNIAITNGLVLSPEMLSAVEFAHGGWSIQAKGGYAKPSSLAMLLHCADLLSSQVGKTRNKK